MYCLLGDIEFKLTEIEGISIEKGYSNPELPVIDSKPITQNTGEELEKITLKMIFDRFFCNPDEQIEALGKAGGKALPLVFGNGFYRGDYTLENVSSEIVTTDEKGNILSIEVIVELKEYISPSQEAAKRRQLTKNFPVKEDNNNTEENTVSEMNRLTRQVA